MIHISAVSYLNTLPFIYGIEKSGFISPDEYILSRDIPSLCAKKLETNNADLVLCPVAAIANKNNINIVTDFCIGAKRNVASVLLVSQQPIHELSEVYLDYQSRTSVTLARILTEKFWKLNFKWLEASPGYEKNIDKSTGGIIIGDRALELSDNYKYKYDLATEWNNFTKLPFVFACWASVNKISPDFLNRFNQALSWGIGHIKDIKPNYPTLSDDFIREYFTNNIDYILDAKKNESMDLFFSYMKSVSPLTK
jgi:chorismate dehydratase